LQKSRLQQYLRSNLISTFFQNKHDKEVFGKTDSLKHPVSLFMHD